MITAARPTNEGPSHWYKPTGEAVYTVPNKSKPGEFRKTTLRDAKTLGLVPSPTGIVRILHRQALVDWICEQHCLAVLTTPRLDSESIDDFVQRVIHTDRVQDQERDAAAEKGKAIHRAIQDALASPFKPVDPEWVLYIAPAIRELNILGKCVATEKTIPGDGYCGMTDCLLENDHEVWVVDFKCRKTIPDKPYDEERLQIGAYCGGLGNTGNKRIRGMLVYISTTNPGEIKVVDVENWPADYRRFRLLLEFYKLTNNL